MVALRRGRTACWLLLVGTLLGGIIVLSSVSDDVLLSIHRGRSNVKPTKDGHVPQIVWLMSFGGSGTSYTLLNTERITGFNTATNYGSQLQGSPPLLADTQLGPILHRPQLPLGNTVLTKTHCGAYCMQCVPSAYIMDTDRFEEACCTVDSPEGSYTYHKSLPKKSVHLIRNPFDNLVGRMHIGSKRRSIGNTTLFESNKRGFSDWCKQLDKTMSKLEKKSTLVELFRRYRDLPCHSEWYKFVQWHNRALEVVNRLGLPVHYLFYENYTDAYNETVRQLYNFLDLPIAHATLEFVSGKGYRDYFDNHIVLRATELVREIASPLLWSLLRHYF